MSFSLEAVGIDVLFGSRPVLRSVSLKIPSDGFVGILGPNGSGKTTLLRALLGLAPLQKGEVFLAGKNLAEWPPRDRARQIAYVPQFSSPLAGWRVRDLVAMGRTPYGSFFRSGDARRPEVVAGVLEQVGLTDLADRPLTELSGGECQRAVIGRALAQEAPILVLDEPTAHLDIRHQMEVLSLLSDLSHTHSVVVALHDVTLAARFCRDIVFLKEGEILVQGPAPSTLTPENISTAFEIAGDKIGWLFESRSV